MHYANIKKNLFGVILMICHLQVYEEEKGSEVRVGLLIQASWGETLYPAMLLASSDSKIQIQ